MSEAHEFRQKQSLRSKFGKRCSVTGLLEGFRRPADNHAPTLAVPRRVEIGRDPVADLGLHPLVADELGPQRFPLGRQGGVQYSNHICMSPPGGCCARGRPMVLIMVNRVLILSNPLLSYQGAAPSAG